MTWAIWITGIPGSGKSAIARAAAAQLAAHAEPVQLLELDALRRVLTPAPSYDGAERDAVYRALVAIARSLTAAGRAVLIDATGHRREWRNLARACIATFAEVQLVCPLAVARERERTRAPGHHPRGIYAQAGRAGATVPGVDVPYEEAASPALVIDTTAESATSAGARVAALALSLGRAFAPRPTTAGWAIWISGPPGSGKTTIARNVHARRTARPMKTVVLDVVDFTALIAPDGIPSALQSAIATRAIVLTAKLLVEAGVAVVIDGAAPVQDADVLARQQIESFALVELVCPTALCRARERAARWNLGARPSPRRATATPDLGLDYITPRRPDLVLYTGVLDANQSVDEVLRLVARLEGTTRSRIGACV